MNNKKPWNFCETPEEKCTMNYCDDNGCQNRKRNYVQGNDLIADVSNCATWQPTMILRWYETDSYNPINEDFDKVLQQKWQSSEGEEKWEDIEVY